MFCIEYLESLYSMHSTLPPAPHVAEPLHPEVGGHGGVPDAAAAVVHAVGGVQHQLKVSVQMSESPACVVGLTRPAVNIRWFISSPISDLQH